MWPCPHWDPPGARGFLCGTACLASPTKCPSLGEPWGPAETWWGESPCACGGHLVWTFPKGARVLLQPCPHHGPLSPCHPQAHEQAAAQCGEEDQPLGTELAPGRCGQPCLQSAPSRPCRCHLLKCHPSPPCPQLENLSNFIKAMASYGMNPVDLFEANDLFESGNLTQVQVSLLALAGMVSAGGPVAWEGSQPHGDGLGRPSAWDGACGTPQLPLPRGCEMWDPVLPHCCSRTGQDEGDAERCGHRREVLGEAAEEL